MRLGQGWTVGSRSLNLRVGVNSSRSKISSALPLAGVKDRRTSPRDPAGVPQSRDQRLTPTFAAPFRFRFGVSV